MSFLLDNIKTEASPTTPGQKQENSFLDPVFEKLKTEKIAIVGLGYVGLPLAAHLAQKFQYVMGVDSNPDRIRALKDGIDRTQEISSAQLKDCGLHVTDSVSEMAAATVFIVTVPTPITASHQPDLSPLKSACCSIAPYLKKGDIVVFESTVYPGVTEDFCGPILEQLSGLKAGVDFNLGYSPERINPGDKVNTVENITKIISADSEAALDRLEAIYGAVIKAGLYRCPSIKVAEAAKVLENTQRDVNIALMNELSLICDRIGIATQDVIDAAATKWNFVPFTPGLVGGHCIGVDPYYLASLAEQLGLHPQVILAGRRMNDEMVSHVTQAALRQLIKSGVAPRAARIGVLGITFKENVPDIRNSKAVELVHQLQAFGLEPMVHDPHCSLQDAIQQKLKMSLRAKITDLDLLILACPHDVYVQDESLLDCVKPGGAIMDIRGALKRRDLGERSYWTL